LLVALTAAVTLKFALAAPAAIVTDPGTVRAVLLLARATVAPPEGAACVSLTVHVLAPPGPRLLGLHDTAETSAGATRLIVAF
jgi:hypothetical protein